MSSSLALCCLPSVKKQKHDFHFLFFRSMHNKTIIRFGFCDIQNNQGRGRHSLVFASSPLSQLIISITKFSIVTGSPCAHLSRNRQGITWLSNYRYLFTTFFNWIPTLSARQLLALQWFPVFPRFLKLMESTSDFLALKTFSEDFSNFVICYRHD